MRKTKHIKITVSVWISFWYFSIFWLFFSFSFFLILWCFLYSVYKQNIFLKFQLMKRATKCFCFDLSCFLLFKFSQVCCYAGIFVIMFCQSLLSQNTIMVCQEKANLKSGKDNFMIFSFHFGFRLLYRIT